MVTTVTASLKVALAVTTSPAFKKLFCDPVAEVMATLLTVGATLSIVTLTEELESDFFLALDKPKSPNVPKELLPPTVNQEKNPPELSSSSSDFFLSFLATFSEFRLYPPSWYGLPPFSTPPPAAPLLFLSSCAKGLGESEGSAPGRPSTFRSTPFFCSITILLGGAFGLLL